MNPNTPKKYWFPPKRYGYGWGPPSTWQGWLVMIAWFLILVGVSLLLAERHFPLFFVFVAFMTGLLLTIAIVKGDPAGRHWRWRHKESPHDEPSVPSAATTSASN